MNKSKDLNHKFGILLSITEGSSIVHISLCWFILIGKDQNKYNLLN
jgi:hypothetical protein